MYTIHGCNCLSQLYLFGLLPMFVTMSDASGLDGRIDSHAACNKLTTVYGAQ